jgi:hypothetical protein
MKQYDINAEYTYDPFSHKEGVIHIPAPSHLSCAGEECNNHCTQTRGSCWSGFSEENPPPDYVAFSRAPDTISKYRPFNDVLEIFQGHCMPAQYETYLQLANARNREYYQSQYQKYCKALGHRKVVLAGGCIRDKFLLDEKAINDLDVWILGCKENSPPAPGEGDPELNDLLWEVGRSIADWRPYTSSDYMLKRMSERSTNKVLNIMNLKAKYLVPHPVQVMSTTATTVEELIGDFDWGVCQFAYDGLNFWFDGWRDYSLNSLLLNDDHIYDPFHTLKRGVLLSHKFRKHGLRLEKATALTLLSLMLMQSNGADMHMGARIEITD